ncbi:MAG: methylenetetrahydromethanopterin dehydrogenase [Pirellulales bacterium]|nr:methylenetetrahydromethanopterin dehydrogenase [Pirellulales bacterium]
MTKRSVLIQLDTDQQPSSFDAIVAVDAGVDVQLRHGNVSLEDVRDLVYGAMFTRSPDDLKNTAIFVGGSDVSAGERIFENVGKTFFGPLRVSAMLDSNGANTTAAAAVLAVLKHVPIDGHDEITVTVLGATGPVGSRVALLLAGLGYRVCMASRKLDRASEAAARIRQRLRDANLEAVQAGNEQEISQTLEGASVLVSAGAIGAQLANQATWSQAAGIQLAIDLNAAAPGGLEGIDPQDKAQDRNGMTCYGALGIGGVKMKIHKACLKRLFERNDLLLDAEQILAVGRELVAQGLNV